MSVSQARPASRFCSRTDCRGNGLADWRPLLKLRPYKCQGKATEVDISIGVCGGCKEHMAKEGAETVLGGDMWKSILSVMAYRGHATPKRHLAVLSFERATDENNPSMWKDS